MAPQAADRDGARLIPPAALAAVPGWAAGGGTIARLEGGIVNRSFRVTTAAGAYALRLSPGREAAAALGIDRDLECELQSLAAAAGLAPRIVATDAAHRFLVSELAPGRRWSAAQMREPAALRRLGAVLARLHAIVVPAPLVAAARAAPTLIGRVRAQARALGGEAADAACIDGRTLPALLEHAEADFARAGVAPRPAVVHSDAHHANLVEGERLLLIDWEYAHVGDPLEDLASLLAAEPAILEQRRAEELLVDFGLEQRADAAMLAALVRVFRSLNALWQCRAQRIDPPCAGGPAPS